MSPDSKPIAGIGKTLTVAMLVSLVCSLIVASATVLLRPLQAKNETLSRQQNILAAASILRADQSVAEQFKRVEMRLVDLATGEYSDDIDLSKYDPQAAARDSVLGVNISAENDIAGLKRRGKHGVVYLVKHDGRIRYIILPVRGYGLWSTMYGYLALERNANTIAGLRFYQHGETPGLGAEIDNPDWLAQWTGKYVYDTDGKPVIEVIRGKVIADSISGATPGDAEYQVDGLAGATLTGRGVTNMLRYWLGADGYGPYLARIWDEHS